MKRSRSARQGLAAVALLLLFTACQAPAAPPVSGLWEALPPAPVGPPSPLELACPAADSCYGIGYHAAVAHWDGRAWTALPVPVPADETWELEAVSCPTPTTCLFAGGRYRPEADAPKAALFLRWDGHAFTDVRLDTDPLTALSCPATDWCLLYNRWDGHAMFRWDGSTLTPVPPPANIRFKEDGAFLSCGAPTSCAAVGWSNTPVGGRSPQVLLRWDGAAWTASAVRTTAAGYLDVGSLSCAGPSFCAAVGHAILWLLPEVPLYGTAVAATRTPAGWSTFSSVQSGPPSSQLNEAYDELSCASPTWCLATGYRNTADGSHPAAIAWTGTGWAAAPSIPDAGVTSAKSCAPDTRTCVVSGGGAPWRFTAG
jgi:hypothetical protein